MKNTRKFHMQEKPIDLSYVIYTFLKNKDIIKVIKK